MDEVQNDMSERVRHVERDIELAKLEPVEGAAYHSYDNQYEPLCHPGTRSEIIRAVAEWVSEPEGKCIYWLQGMAGTGKSTICRTLAHEFERTGILGAAYFFKRGEGDRGTATRFFPTIVAQLNRARDPWLDIPKSDIFLRSALSLSIE